MRRDYFELDVSNVAWVSDEGKPKKPRVEIDFYGPSAELKRQLSKPSGEYLDASETDVTFRLQDDVNESDASGVVSVTNRITGDFILELNQRAEDVLSFINAAREYGKEQGTNSGEGRYLIDVRIEGDEIVKYDKETFLTYDAEGNLLRSQSLIPSGVEL
ncbi:MAG: hypothetical protein J07HQX50_00434 [Haloquadratum sp. J07HQX50]|jgi:hypothetical protein|nr:MAG: hypothetical protein J07HQX50_00434 [Haloquadratum sp. J07HQX50]